MSNIAPPSPRQRQKQKANEMEVVPKLYVSFSAELFEDADKEKDVKMNKTHVNAILKLYKSVPLEHLDAELHLEELWYTKPSEYLYDVNEKQKKADIGEFCMIISGPGIHYHEDNDSLDTTIDMVVNRYDYVDKHPPITVGTKNYYISVFIENVTRLQ
jgi:hypothetical protein